MIEEGTSNQAMSDIPQIAPFDPTKKKKKKKVSILHRSMEREEKLPCLCNSSMRIAARRMWKKIHLFNNLGIHGKKVNVITSIKSLVEKFDGQVFWLLNVQLLQRVFGLLQENNPELTGDKQRTVFRPPQVFPEGTTKTVFDNFMDLCKLMRRQPELVMTFMLTELNTFGSLDGDKRLIVEGRFSPTNLECVLRTYINEYVLCHVCRCPDTILSNENTVFLLQCDLCGSEQSVGSNGAGYGTRVERRKTRQNLGFESV